jgi:hypothetical protein
VDAKVLAMSSEHGRRLDEYRGIEEFGPYSIESHTQTNGGLRRAEGGVGAAA